MLNYIRAEFYKLMHRKYTYIALASMLALEAIPVLGAMFHNTHSFPHYFGDTITIIPEMGSVGIFMCMFTADIVFAGQYKNSTLKNEVSFGLSRSCVYLGKLIAQTLLSVIYLAVMMAFFLGLSWVALPHDPAIDMQGLQSVGYYLAACFPLWLGGQAVVCFCLFIVGSDLGSSFLYVAIMVAVDPILELIALFAGGGVGAALLIVVEHMPNRMINAAKEVTGDWNFCGKAWIVGAVWMAVFTAAGLLAFRKKEIK